MSETPWHKRYHSDALTGYRALTLEQRGAYSTILDLLYDSGVEALPASDRWMAGQLDVSVRKWRRLKAELQNAGKIIIRPDGRITNSRFLRERAKAEAVSQMRAEAGRKGGKTSKHELEFELREGGSTPENGLQRSGDNAFSPPANQMSQKNKLGLAPEKDKELNGTAQASAQADPPVRTRIPDPRSQNPDINNNIDDSDYSRREGVFVEDISDLTTRIATAGCVSIINPTRLASAVEIVQQWVRNGISVEATIIPTIERCVRDLPAHQTVGSLAFFDAAIRKAHAIASPAPQQRKPKASTTPTRFLDHSAEPLRVTKLRERIRECCGTRIYQQWLHPTLWHLNGNSLTIEAPSPFLADWITDNLRDMIADEAQLPVIVRR